MITASRIRRVLNPIFLIAGSSVSAPVFCGSLAFVCLAIFTGLVSCGNQIIDRSLEGRTISSLSFRYPGEPAVDEQRLRAGIKSQPGTPYSRKQTDADLTSLWASGLIMDMHWVAEPGGETVRLTAVVTPPPRYGPTPFVGNKAFSDQKLAAQTGVKYDMPIDFKIPSKLEEFYHRNGYPDATVAVRVFKKDPPSVNEFQFIIDEGTKSEMGNGSTGGSRGQRD